MNWHIVLSGKAFEEWLKQRGTPAQIKQGQRLDLFAPSMRDFKAATNNLIEAEHGSQLPARGGAGNQAFTDLSGARLVGGTVDHPHLTELGKAALDAWREASVADDQDTHELARCLLLLQHARRQQVAEYLKMMDFWADIRSVLRFKELMADPYQLYAVSYLDMELAGLNPWALIVRAGLAPVTSAMGWLDELKSQFPTIRPQIEKLQTRIKDWGDRPQGRKTFCAAMELLRLLPTEALSLLQEMSAHPGAYIGTIPASTIELTRKLLAASDIATLATQFAADLATPQVAIKVDKDLQTRFIASLLSKKFLILGGLAGSGKTKLAQAFAHWITDPRWSDPADHSKGKKENPQFAVVPVGADWTGNENILGYPNGLDATAYVTKPALQLIRRALQPENKEQPHVLILDEMNLSHVERYFADILSAIESGERIPLYDGAERKTDGSAVPNTLRLPSNLFVIGTVNVDETTYMFSPKVLDRANVIEFRMDPADMATFLANPQAPNLDELDGKGTAFGPALVKAASDKAATVPPEVTTHYTTEMTLFFNLLRAHSAEFGYRVGYESGRLLHFYKALGGYAATETSWAPKAIDAVIVQKLLPKLHGSRSKLEGLLWAIAWACGMQRTDRGGKDFATQLSEASQAQDESKYGPEVVWADLQAKNPADPPKAAPYPLSLDKVMRMWRKLVRDQFTSFSDA